MMEKKVSIIIPVYNCGEVIEECINSLLRQQYKNVELLFIDDGSVDDSYKILYAYKEKYKEIKLFRQENHGQAHARNVGLRNATGEYVMFCDADDFLCKEAVSICVSEMNNYGLDVVLFNCNMFDPYGNEYKGITFPGGKRICNSLLNEDSELYGLFANVCFGCFSMDRIRKGRLQFLEGTIYEDWEFMAHYLASTSRAKWIDLELYNYRWNWKGSTSHIVSEKCLDVFTAMRRAKNYFVEAGRWYNVEYAFYYKSLLQIYSFFRDRLSGSRVKEKIICDYKKQMVELINEIPFELLLSIVSIFGIHDRTIILRMHRDGNSNSLECYEVERSLQNRKREKIRCLYDRFFRVVSPTYRATTNLRTRLEELQQEVYRMKVEIEKRNSKEKEKMTIDYYLDKDRFI